MADETNNSTNRPITFNTYRWGMTARVACLMLLFVFIPMIFTSISIEKGLLLPGKNLYMAIPLFFIILLIPLSRAIAHHLINRDLMVVDQFCSEIKKGNYEITFRLGNQKESEDPFTSLLRNLTWMSRHVAAREAFSQNKLQKFQKNLGKLEKKALTDPLTGLFNRRYLEQVSTEISASDRYRLVSMVYIDCDRFKAVNDTLGHNIGDDLLKWLAGCLKHACRLNHDIPLRMGGDEFALLLPGAGTDQAVMIAKRLRSLYHREDVYCTTLSIGIATIPCGGNNAGSCFEVITEHADRQAYISKQAGGDNICIDNKLEIVPEKTASQRNSLEEIHKLANYDPLTGIPNRYLAKERFKRALKRSRRNGLKFCVMFIDLDDFKTINNSLGHHIGDEYLKHIAQCLKKTLRAEDSICRLGGDEFLIIAENIARRDAVAALAVKVIESVKIPLYIDECHVMTTTSVGITLVPDDGENFDDLCKRADMALFRAKENGKNSFCMFEPTMAKTVDESLDLITDLRTAIDSGQLELYFQPQIDLGSQQIIGAEALIRWHHPKKGMMPPTIFIPLAERSGQIVEMGEWIIDQACRKCAQWNRSIADNFTIAINISPIQIIRSSLSDTVLSTLDKHQLGSGHIELEFTESLLLHNSPEIKAKLSVLREAGVHLSIDDFGTGYSNLSYLKEFDISRIKVDKSFIQTLMDHRQDRAIVRAIIQMANSLNIQTVAEGIEDRQSMELLQNMGCAIGQGFYWAQPLPEKQFLEYYRQINLADR
jgi:diguanylate cyclase (GGDEF)-like protein